MFCRSVRFEKALKTVSDELERASCASVHPGRAQAFALCAILITFNACQKSPQSQVKQNGTSPPTGQTQAREVSAEVQIVEDEAMLKGSQAVIAGTVQNIGGSSLENLTIELELKRHKDGTSEKRTVAVEPQSLAPEEKGRYSLTVSREWNSARILYLRSAGRAEHVAFKSERGALRPPERLPDNRTKVVVIPRPKSQGEEFINTPETAVPVP